MSLHLEKNLIERRPYNFSVTTQNLLLNGIIMEEVGLKASTNVNIWVFHLLLVDMELMLSRYFGQGY